VSAISSPWWAKLLGLAPVPAPPHVFALEAGRLRYGRFNREGGGFRFAESHSVELPADAFHLGPLGGPLRDSDLLRGRLALVLERLSQPPREASLILPDAWLRIGFADAGELPRDGAARQAVLQFKLRRQVPYRVEDLRVEATEVEPLAGQSSEEPHRYLLGFAVEALLAQIEDVFAERSIQLGTITNTSLSALGALAGGAGEAGVGLLLGRDDGFVLAVARRGLPLVHRYKTWDGLPEGARADLVVRDLRLTRSFLDQNLPGLSLGRVVVSASPENAAVWRDWLAAGLEVRAEALSREHLPQLQGELPPNWRDAAAMLGAAGLEIA
jgi:hypothetical protein